MTLRGSWSKGIIPDDATIARLIETNLCSGEVTSVALDAIDPLIRRSTGIGLTTPTLVEIWENAVTAAFEYLLDGASQ